MWERQSRALDEICDVLQTVFWHESTFAGDMGGSANGGLFREQPDMDDDNVQHFIAPSLRRRTVMVPRPGSTSQSKDGLMSEHELRLFRDWVAYDPIGVDYWNREGAP